jgi:hypothetical protein
MEKIYKLILIVLCLFSEKAFSQCATPTSTPYYENFSGITVNGQLPNCWAISNPSTCITFTSGGSTTGGAAFYYSPAGSNYFYTNGIQLTAGITYSTSLWYQAVGISSQASWTNLSILYGTSQSNTSLTLVASSVGNLTNTNYSALTNTFAVPVSGVYYVAIKATSNGSGGVYYLNWDDLEITVPCTSSYNTPSVTIVSSSTVFCSNDTITLTALGADTYTWSNGFQGSVYTGSPFGSNISVVGVSNLTGCTYTATSFVPLYASPNMAVVSSSPKVCIGTSAVLTALGASTFTWSNGSQTPTISVTPTVASSYTVIGTANNGCKAAVTQSINVVSLPVITYTSSASSSTICKGDLVTFTTDVQAGLSYTWSTNNGGAVVVGQGFTLSPVSTVTVSLTGKDQNGCSSIYGSELTVNECASLTEALKDAEIKIYPNPGTGTYHIVSDNSGMKTIDVSDLAGKIIYSTESKNNEILLNLTIFDNGIYQVVISNESSRYYYKIIKQ